MCRSIILNAWYHERVWKGDNAESSCVGVFGAEFHMVCVDQWLTTRRPFCPVCKRDARTSNPSPVPTEQTPLLGAIFGSSARSSSRRQARTSRAGDGANSEAGPSMVHEEAGIPGARLGAGNGIVAVDMPAAAGEVPSTSASHSVSSRGG